jgi:hypothetical protein
MTHHMFGYERATSGLLLNEEMTWRHGVILGERESRVLA